MDRDDDTNAVACNEVLRVQPNVATHFGFGHASRDRCRDRSTEYGAGFLVPPHHPIDEQPDVFNSAARQKKVAQHDLVAITCATPAEVAHDAVSHVPERDAQDIRRTFRQRAADRFDRKMENSMRTHIASPKCTVMRANLRRLDGRADVRPQVKQLFTFASLRATWKRGIVSTDVKPASLRKEIPVKYTKLEMLTRKKAALAQELALIDQNLAALNNETDAASEKVAKANAAIRGAVLDRLMQKRHAADPALAQAELHELSKILVNRKERKAFGLPPLPVGGPEHGAASLQ